MLVNCFSYFQYKWTTPIKMHILISFYFFYSGVSVKHSPSYCILICSPVPDNSQNFGTLAKQTTPSLKISSSSSSPSPLSMFLKSLPPLTTTPKSTKGMSARDPGPNGGEGKKKAAEDKEQRGEIEAVTGRIEV